MATVEGLMNEVAASLQFFDEFGENWYALEECLCYLDEWLPAEAYVLVVEHADDMLRHDDEALRAFLATCHAAGEFWSHPVDGPERFQRGPVPFHVLLNVDPGLHSAVERILRAASEVDVPIRSDHAWNGP